jgi:hypothetical protein
VAATLGWASVRKKDVMTTPLAVRYETPPSHPMGERRKMRGIAAPGSQF